MTALLWIGEVYVVFAEMGSETWPYEMQNWSLRSSLLFFEIFEHLLIIVDQLRVGLDYPQLKKT